MIVYIIKGPRAVRKESDSQHRWFLESVLKNTALVIDNRVSLLIYHKM